MSKSIRQILEELWPDDCHDGFRDRPPGQKVQPQTPDRSTRETLEALWSEGDEEPLMSRAQCRVVSPSTPVPENTDTTEVQFEEGSWLPGFTDKKRYESPEANLRSAAHAVRSTARGAVEGAPMLRTDTPGRPRSSQWLGGQAPQPWATFLIEDKEWFGFGDPYYTQSRVTPTIGGGIEKPPSGAYAWVVSMPYNRSDDTLRPTEDYLKELKDKAKRWGLTNGYLVLQSGETLEFYP